MPARPQRRTVRRQTAGERAGATVAVYHASGDVDRHVAALRRARRWRIVCFPQPTDGVGLVATAFDAVLWELVPGATPARRLGSVARTAGAVSYSADRGRRTAQLSRALGFVSHLQAPLKLADVERSLGAVGGAGLLERVAACQTPLRRQLSRTEVIAELVRGVGASLDTPEVAKYLVARLSEMIPMPCWAVVMGGDEAEPELVATARLPPELEATARAVGARVLGQGDGLALGSLQRDAGTTDVRDVAVLAFALTGRGRTIAALVGLDGEPAAGRPRLAGSTTAALEAFLGPAAIALDNASRVQRLEALSVTDDLTGLYNSRYLSQALHRETKRAGRTGRPVSLVFVDLDGFKSVNDRFGHLNGSRALVEAGEVIRSSARETDVVARYGGDEFALVLSDTIAEGAVAVGRRVRQRVAEHRFLSAEDLNLSLSASVGVATLPDVGSTAEELIRRADEAMYWVKGHGKNGIHVAGR